MPNRRTFASVDEYIEAAEPGVRNTLHAIRATVAKAVPGATECISYQMPALRQKKIFLYFAAFKNHIGVYPPVRDPALDSALARYRGPNGNLQFPLAEPIPLGLLRRIALSLAAQHAIGSK